VGKKVKRFISRYFFSDALPLEGRIFNLVLGFGIVACLGAMIARIFEKVAPIVIMAVGAMILVIVITFLICNKFRSYHLGIWAALVLVCDILFPLVFFANAGVESGIAGYFVLTIALIFLLLRGRECAVMLASHLIIVLGCYLAQWFYPDLITPFSAKIQQYVDHVQIILISGVFIGLVIKYQGRIYEEEKNKAEAATRVKGNFLANVSHELRTPLNAVIGLGELELRKDLPKDTYANLEKIHSSGMVLLNIINDLLDVSKIESGRFQLVPVNYRVAALISDTVNINMVRLENKPVVFRLKVNEELPATLFGDELRIRQILNNLLSNAFKYTREGAITLDVDFVRDDDSGKNIFLICRVEDTGIGIRREDLGNLFSAYNQLDIMNNRRIEGTGLGLSICKNLVEMMDGDIAVESEYGKGSVFTIRIRQAAVDASPIGRDTRESLEQFHYRTAIHRERRKQPRVKMPYARVLVVDDVATNVDVAKGMMLPYGLTIDCAGSGREAVELVREGKVRYNAIFMDQMMPEMDGLEAVRIIRREIGTEYAKTVPIIALTANAIIGADAVFLEQGFQDYLSKPIDMSKLDACLNRWVRDRDQEALAPEAPPAPPEAGTEAPPAPGSPPFIEGVDFAAGVGRMGGREESFVRVLNSYVLHMPALLEKIRRFNAEFINDYTITIHGIKGSSYGICAQETGKWAEALEMAARKGDIETILAKNERFIHDTEKLVERIRAFLAPKNFA
jgi:signal transduction histidine kinase/CheY-like chemotaxis protein